MSGHTANRTKLSKPKSRVLDASDTHDALTPIKELQMEEEEEDEEHRVGFYPSRVSMDYAKSYASVMHARNAPKREVCHVSTLCEILPVTLSIDYAKSYVSVMHARNAPNREVGHVSALCEIFHISHLPVIDTKSFVLIGLVAFSIRFFLYNFVVASCLSRSRFCQDGV